MLLDGRPILPWENKLKISTKLCAQVNQPQWPRQIIQMIQAQGNGSKDLWEFNF